MYLGEQERAKRKAAIVRELNESAAQSWQVCAEASCALLALGSDSEFQRLVDGHRGLPGVLPALLAASGSPDRADAMLHLVVARATLSPLLVRMEILGWMAHTHPQALVTLLAVVAGDHEHASSNNTGVDAN